MKTRKHHSKSRYGCDPCKQRRTKCDEQGPPCASCVIRRAHCHYSLVRDPSKSGAAAARRSRVPGGSPLSPSTDSHSEPPNTDTASPGPSPSVVTNNDRQEIIPTVHGRLTELELMRFWCRKTCYSFAVDTSLLEYETWIGPVIDLALSNKFLMDSILALTCAQIATEKEDPRVASLYVNAALQYQGNAFANARMVLDHISEDNCEALFAFSLCNIPCSIVSSQLPSGRLDAVQTPIQSVIISFKYVRMIRALWAVAMEWLKKGPFSRAVDIGESDEYSSCDTAMIPIMQRLRSLIEQYIETAKVPEDQVRSYLHAFSLLDHFFVFSKPKAVGWLGMTDELFLENLKQETYVGLLMLMHWGVLLDQLQHMWWTKWTGKKLVEEISQKLAGKHDSSWNATCEWAREQVGLEIQQVDGIKPSK